MESVSQQEKTVLARIYLKSLANRLGIEYQPQCSINNEVYSRLEEKGLLYRGRLTPEGRRSIQIGVIGGVFDILHKGHIYTLREARKLVDALIVIIARDATVLKLKGKKAVNSEEDRREVVSAVRYVDLAILGDEEDFTKPIRIVQPDIIILGYDQTLPPGIDIDVLRGRKIVRINLEVEGVKTTEIKRRIVELYRDSFI